MKSKRLQKYFIAKKGEVQLTMMSVCLVIVSDSKLRYLKSQLHIVSINSSQLHRFSKSDELHCKALITS